MANRFLSNITINDAYTFPSADGTNGQIITTDGSGNLSFTDISNLAGAQSNFVYYDVKNSSGSTINKGAAVMAVGTDGNSGHILIDEMVADGSIEPKYFMGVLESTLANGEIGRVIHFGELDQFNTSTFQDGDVLWCDPATPGGFTTTEPLGPNLKLAAAIVINAATNGKIKVRVQGNAGLHELHDVKITTQADGDLLQWNNTLGVWENKTLASIADGRYVNTVGDDSMTGILTARAFRTLSTSTTYSLLTRDTVAGNFAIYINHANSASDSRIARFAYGDTAANSGTEVLNIGGDTSYFVNTNLGIGTTSPAYKLTVEDSIYTAVGLYSNYDYQENRNWAWRLNTFGTGNWGGIGLWQSASAGTSPSSGTIRFGIDKSGKVGIGVTEPESSLHILGANSAAGGITLTSSTSDATQKVGRIKTSHYTNSEEPFTAILTNAQSTENAISIGGGSGAENAATYIRFFTADNTTTLTGTERMRIESNGNVSIGPNTPQTKLHIQANTTNSQLRLTRTGTATGEFDIFTNTDSLFFKNVANDSFPLFIDDTDRIGINNLSPSEALDVDGLVKATGFTSDGNAKSYTWRPISNTSTNSGYFKIARINGTQSARFVIELIGRSSSYSDNALPAMGHIVGQLNNDNNYDIVFYNSSSSESEVVTSVGQVDVDDYSTDIYVQVSTYNELVATASISRGSITTYSTSPVESQPTGYVSANREYKVWNSGNDTEVFRNKGTIPGSANLNSYRTTGIYSQESNANALSGSNYPIDLAGQLVVYNQDYGNGLQTKQYYLRYNLNEIYYRSYYNGTWQEWVKLVTESDGEITAPKLRLTSTDDASLTSTGHGLQVGSTGAQNIIVDANEIMARNNGATSTLYLQNDGGSTSIGGSLSISGSLSGVTNAGSNVFVDGDSVINMANNDGFVYDDANNKMYVKLDGTDYEILHSNNYSSITDSGNDTRYARKDNELTLSQNNTFAYMHFARVTITSGENQLNSSWIFRLSSYETAHEKQALVFLSIRRTSADAVGAIALTKSNLGQSDIGKIYCVSDDNVTFDLYYECEGGGSGYTGFRRIQTVKNHPQTLDPLFGFTRSHVAIGSTPSGTTISLEATNQEGIFENVTIRTTEVIDSSQRFYGAETVSNSVPAYTFTNDTDTGLSRIGADSVGLIAGGSRKFYVNASTGYFQNLTNGVEFNSSITMNDGNINAAANKYYESDSSYALNLRNSDIIGLNSMYFLDNTENSGEGINFYRSSTQWDTLRASAGELYFAPGRTSGTADTGYTVLHSGNHTSYTDSKYLLSNDNDTATGRITIQTSGNPTVGGATPSNGYLYLTDGTAGVGFDTNELHSTDQYYIGTNSGHLVLRPSDAVLINTTSITGTGKLIVGGELIASSSAIAQFDGFIRLEQQLFLHDPTDNAIELQMLYEKDNGLGIIGTNGGSNKVGIGTNTPSEQLEVVGNALFTGNITTSGSGSNVIRWTNTTAAQSWITYVGSNDDFIIRDETDSRTVVQLQGDGDVVFPAGAVAIGTTDVAYPFTLESAGTGLAARIYNSNADGQGLLIRAGSTSSNTRVLQLASSNDTKIMTVTSNGKVGIGTPNPSSRLHVTATGVTNKAVDGYAIGVFEDTEAHIQLIGVDSGSWASSIVLTNAPDSGTNRHWHLHHAPITNTSYSKALNFSYNETNTTSDIGGDSGSVAFSMKDNLAVQAPYVMLGRPAGADNTIEFVNGIGSESYIGGHINYHGSGDLTLCAGGGDVAIGATSAASSSKLHVVGSAVSGADYDEAATLIVESAEGRLQLIANNDGNDAAAIILSTGDATNQHWVIGQRGPARSNKLQIGYKTSTASGNIATGDFADLTIDTDGKVGIGIESPEEKLHVNGAIKTFGGIFSAYGNYTNASVYTNYWQKVLEIPFSAFGYTAFTLSIIETGDTSNVSLNAQVYINYKNQNGTLRINANIVNYGELPLTTDNFEIYRDNANSKMCVYHRVTRNYSQPVYAIKDNGVTVNWTTAVIGTSLSGETNDAFSEKNISNTANFNVLTGAANFGAVGAIDNEKVVFNNHLSFGNPGNGSNTSGRWLSFEGNTDASGEGSGRIFFTEHNSTTASMDAYGMSIGYRGGGTTITGASGNDWTGLSQIGNGQWGMWGHNADATGALIMYGDRTATYVNFAGNDILNPGRVAIGGSSFTGSAQLTVNGTLSSGSSAIAQFNGFVRVRDQLLLHNTNNIAQDAYFQCTGQNAITMSGTFTAVGDVIAYSDERVKENIKTIDNALDKVLEMRGVSYNRTDTEDKSAKVGVIAQEIQKVLPEVVSENNEGILGVSYGNIVGVLIEAIKEQQKQIEELKTIINNK